MVSDSQDVYKVQARVAGKYRLLIIRGHPLHEQPSKVSFPEKRKAGDTNLDLWLDGSIYPADAITQRPPGFQSLPDFLEFVGDGERSLLGYVRNLQNSSGSTSMLVRQRDTEISLLRSQIDELMQSFGREQTNFDNRRLQEVPHLQTENRHLETQVAQLEESMCALTRDHNNSTDKLRHEREALDFLRAQLEKSDAVKDQEMQQLRMLYERQLLVLNNSLAEAMRTAQKLEQKRERMKKHHLGIELR